MIPFVKLRQWELMKGIKWPQIKGNLGSKACLHVRVTWRWQLSPRASSTLGMNLSGKLCFIGLYVWLETFLWASCKQATQPIIRWPLAHVTISTCYLCGSESGFWNLASRQLGWSLSALRSRVLVREFGQDGKAGMGEVHWKWFPWI
jgi:hypothetical protein